MKIDIDHVANLAHLPLSEDERTMFQKQLENIVTFVEKLNEVDTTGIDPTFQVTGKVNELRFDEPKSSLSVEEALQNAEQTEGSCIVTKGVFDDLD